MFFCVSGFGVATFPDVHRHFITEVYFDIMKAVLLQQQQQQQQKKLNKKGTKDTMKNTSAGMKSRAEQG